MIKRFVPIAEAPEHAVPGTKESLHWIAFHREYNGAEKAGAIIKFGGRLYIDPEKFFAWMATQPRISPPVDRKKKKQENRKRTQRVAA